MARHFAWAYLVGIALLALLTPPSIAADSAGPPRFGKTNADILALGRVAWFAWYTSPAQAGDSDPAVQAALALYHAAARTANDALLADGQYGDIAALRDELQAFAATAVSLGRNVTGEETIWPVLEADGLGALEDDIHAMLTGDLAGVSQAAPSAVRAKLKQLARQVRKLKADKKATWFNYAQAQQDLAALSSQLVAITARVAKLPPPAAGLAYSFCATRLDEACGDWMGDQP